MVHRIYAQDRNRDPQATFPSVKSRRTPPPESAFAILELVHTTPAISRKAIARKFDMKAAMVSRLVSALLDARLLVEGSLRSPQRQGRPEVPLYVYPNRVQIPVIYSFTRQINGSLVNLEMQEVASAECDMAADADNETAISAMRDVLSRLLAMVEPGAEVPAIVIALPGWMDTERQTWQRVSRWPRIANASLKNLGQPEDVPLVFRRPSDCWLEALIQNDPLLAHTSVLLTHWGEGIGAAWATDGEVRSSQFGGFGEIGHWKTGTDTERLCHCGKVGCLETVAAIPWLQADLRRIGVDAGDDHQDMAAFLRHAGNKIVNLPPLVTTARLYGQVLAHCFHMLFPERIFMVGLPAYNHVLADLIRESFFDSIPEICHHSVQLSPVECNKFHVLAGGTARLFRDALEGLSWRSVSPPEA